MKPNQKQINKATFRHIKIKLLKTETKEKILKVAARGKRYSFCKVIYNNYSYLLKRNNESELRMEWYFKVLKK